MKQATFQLSQRNGNNVTFEVKDVNKSITQDDFAGTYIFPALLRLVAGSSQMFDKSLPVHLTFSASFDNGEVSAKVLGSVKIKSKSAHAVRQAVLVFNEAIAALAAPTSIVSAYALLDMKGDKGGQFRTYAKGLLRPSVSLNKALMPSMS